MFLVSLICSDQACAEEIELSVASLDELARAACDCGSTLEVLAISEGEDARLRLTAVPGGRATESGPRPADSRRAA